MTDPVWPAALDPSDRGTLYANSVTMAGTQWDITMDFQLATPAPGTPVSETQLTPYRVARIIVSPTHAKVLAGLLTRAVTEWEEKFGKLPDASALMPESPSPAPAAPPDGEQ
jgi:hypothetical protein